MQKKKIKTAFVCVLLCSALRGKSLGEHIQHMPTAKQESIRFVQSVLKDQLGKSTKISIASENLDRLRCAFIKQKPNMTLMDIYTAYYTLPIPIELIGV